MKKNKQIFVFLCIPQTKKVIEVHQIILCVPHYNQVCCASAAKNHSKQMSALALLWSFHCKKITQK